MLNLDEIQTFQAVATSGNFTVAAENLHVTQSTISHQIKRLEERIGQKLFNRTTRSVELTLAGEHFLPYAEKLVEMSKAAEQSLSVDGMTGEVRIGVPEEFAYRNLTELLKRFRLHYPNVVLAIEVGVGSTLSEKLASGGLDLIIVKEAPGSESSIKKEPLVWVGRKELLALETLPFAFYPGSCVFRRVAIEALQSQDIPYSVILISASLEALRIAADAGTVITVTTQSECPKKLLLDSQQHKLPELPDMGYQIKSGAKPTRPTQVAMTIMRELLEK